MAANVQFSVSAGSFDLPMRCLIDVIDVWYTCVLIDVCLVYATWQLCQATSNGLLAWRWLVGAYSTECLFSAVRSGANASWSPLTDMHCSGARCCVVTTACDVSRDGRRSVNASSRRCRRGTIAVRGSLIQLSPLVDRHVNFRLLRKEN
jgi:hypothetical protein